jgi:hypothetical protein
MSKLVSNGAFMSSCGDGEMLSKLVSNGVFMSSRGDSETLSKPVLDGSFKSSCVDSEMLANLKHYAGVSLTKVCGEETGMRFRSRS